MEFWIKLHGRSPLNAHLGNIWWMSFLVFDEISLKEFRIHGRAVTPQPFLLSLIPNLSAAELSMLHPCETIWLENVLKFIVWRSKATHLYASIWIRTRCQWEQEIRVESPFTKITHLPFHFATVVITSEQLRSISGARQENGKNEEEEKKSTVSEDKATQNADMPGAIYMNSLCH